MGVFGKPNIEKLKSLIKVLKVDWYVSEMVTASSYGIVDSRAVVEHLIEALKDEDSYVRKYAVKALGRRGDSQEVEPLIGVLKDEDIGVRRKAVYVLGKIGDERAVEPLTEALDDEDWYVRMRAALALKKIKAKKS